MNFTFVRAERSQEENQERAFIAASRRQDRDYKQRLESLQKASELHFARTGKRFEVTQAQVEHNGPLMELGDHDRRRESRRYQPYPVDRRCGNLRRDGNGADFMFDMGQQRYDAVPHGHHQPVQPHAMFQSRHDETWANETLASTHSEPLLSQPHAGPPSHPRTGSISAPEIDVVESQSQNEVEDTQNLDFDDLHPSFFELETWNEYQEDLHIVDILSYLDMHFPTPRQGTPEEDLHMNNKLGDNERTSPIVWEENVHYNLQDTGEEIENNEGYW